MLATLTAIRYEFPFVVLSHCWGGSQPLTLIAETEEQWRYEVSVHVLPRTFQDAVLVCRKLSYHYLWIDSL